MNDGMEMAMGRDLGLLLPEIAVALTGVFALVAGMIRRPRWALENTKGPEGPLVLLDFTKRLERRRRREHAHRGIA